MFASEDGKTYLFASHAFSFYKGDFQILPQNILECTFFKKEREHSFIIVRHSVGPTSLSSSILTPLASFLQIQCVIKLCFKSLPKKVDRKYIIVWF